MYSAFFAILDYIAAAPRTRKELYEHFGMSCYRQTRDALAELVARGLLSRTPSSPNTRDVFSLTAKGCEQLESGENIALKKHSANTIRNPPRPNASRNAMRIAPIPNEDMQRRIRLR